MVLFSEIKNESRICFYRCSDDGSLDNKKKIWLARNIGTKRFSQSLISHILTLSTKISFSGNIRSIKQKAFENNKQLNEIECGKNLRTIDSYAFKNCQNLEKYDLKMA